MAENKSKSRAEKAVSSARKKSAAASADGKSIENSKKSKPVELPTDDNRIPGRVVLALVSLVLFVQSKLLDS